MEYDLQILENGGLSVQDGLGYTGGKEKYISAIQRYFKNYEANRKAVEEFFEKGDTENYMIKVHSLKSNSRMIGALKLGDAFEELENAAKTGDTEIIKDKTSGVLEEYAGIIELIRPIGEAESVAVSGEISADEAKTTAAGVLEALNDYDDIKAKELAIKLSGYPFRITQSQMLKEAIDLISDYSYDEASELIEKIVPAIE